MREGLSAMAFGIAGWAISAAAMMVTDWLGSPANAIAVHTVLTPVTFTLVALTYFRRPEPLHPLAAAIVFGTTLLTLDMLVRMIFREAWNLRDLVVEIGIPAYGAAAVTWLTGAAAETSQ